MMHFQIDAQANYTKITPEGAVLDVAGAEALLAQCTQLAASGSQAFIIALHHCTSVVPAAFDSLKELHAVCYEKGRSLVFTGVQDSVWQSMKKHALQEQLNIVPTPAEAIDMISMEALERDLFDEA
jgi:anti-anti-sigma regulatory factor